MGHYEGSEVMPGSFGYALCVNRLYANLMQYFREVKQNSTRNRVMLYTVNLNLGMSIGSIMIQFIENTYHYLFLCDIFGFFPFYAVTSLFIYCLCVCVFVSLVA